MTKPNPTITLDETSVETSVHTTPAYLETTPTGSTRLVWNPNNLKFDSARDLNLNGYAQSEAGMNAILDLVSGKVTGVSNLIFSAPQKKVFNQFATGIAGYVYGNYKNDYVIVSEDNPEMQFPVVLTASQMPEKLNWRRIRFAPGRFSSLPYEEYSPNNKYASQYWWCEAIRAALSGFVVSCSVGSGLIDKARQIDEIVRVADPVELKTRADTYHWAGREERRVAQKMRTGVEAKVAEINVTRHPENMTPEFVVKTTMGPVNLLSFPPSTEYKLIAPNGVALHAHKIPTNRISLQQLAEMINSGGYTFQVVGQ